MGEMQSFLLKIFCYVYKNKRRVSQNYNIGEIEK